MPLMMYAVRLVKLRQYLAPMVFGIISVKTKIKMVSIADIIPNDDSPNTLTACAPTPAAPTVWAIVLSDRMADNGLSMSFFKTINELA